MKKVRGKTFSRRYKAHNDFGLKTEKQIREEAFVKVPVLALGLLLFCLISLSIIFFTL